MAVADVTTVLTPEELDFLRKGFAELPNDLTRLARDSIVAPYVNAAGVVNALPERFFVPPEGGTLPMPEADRERTIIAILAATETDPGLPLAAHFYWGLAVGLSAKDIAETLLLAATYSGLPHWLVSSGRFAALLGQLKAAVKEARERCSKKLGGATSGPEFEKAMREALSPSAMLDLIRRPPTPA